MFRFFKLSKQFWGSNHYLFRYKITDEFLSIADLLSKRIHGSILISRNLYKVHNLSKSMVGIIHLCDQVKYLIEGFDLPSIDISLKTNVSGFWHWINKADF